MRSLVALTLAFGTSAAGIAVAQTSSLPPVRRLGAPVASTPKSFRSLSVVRALPGGKLLVNDVGARRLLLMDTTLAPGAAVLDSGSSTGNEYGARGGGLIAYRGDSTIFVDLIAPSMYMIDPGGAIVRTMSVPAPRDVGWLFQSTASGNWPGTDALGRLIYRGQTPRAPLPQAKVGEWIPFAYPDSAPIQRVDFVTRKPEVVAWYKVAKLAGALTLLSPGQPGSYSVITNNPLVTMDDFAVLSDGTIALLRSDFHIDFIDADGKITASPKIPYPWERLSDDAKVALMDSLKKESEKRSAEPPTTMSGGSTSTSGGGGGLSRAPSDRPEPPEDVRWIKASELPDYRPAFQYAALRADANNNLWIRTLQPAREPNFQVYDVVNRAGKLVDRVEVPRDRTIVGFDVTSVYLAGRDASGAWLERVKIK